MNKVTSDSSKRLPLLLRVVVDVPSRGSLETLGDEMIKLHNQTHGVPVIVSIVHRPVRRCWCVTSRATLCLNNGCCHSCGGVRKGHRPSRVTYISLPSTTPLFFTIFFSVYFSAPGLGFFHSLLHHFLNIHFLFLTFDFSFDFSAEHAVPTQDVRSTGRPCASTFPADRAFVISFD